MQLDKKDVDYYKKYKNKFKEQELLKNKLERESLKEKMSKYSDYMSYTYIGKMEKVDISTIMTKFIKENYDKWKTTKIPVGRRPVYKKITNRKLFSVAISNMGASGNVIYDNFLNGKADPSIYNRTDNLYSYYIQVYAFSSAIINQEKFVDLPENISRLVEDGIKLESMKPPSPKYYHSTSWELILSDILNYISNSPPVFIAFALDYLFESDMKLAKPSEKSLMFGSKTVSDAGHITFDFDEDKMQRDMDRDYLEGRPDEREGVIDFDFDIEKRSDADTDTNELAV